MLFAVECVLNLEQWAHTVKKMLNIKPKVAQKYKLGNEKKYQGFSEWVKGYE